MGKGKKILRDLKKPIKALEARGFEYLLITCRDGANVNVVVGDPTANVIRIGDISKREGGYAKLACDLWAYCNKVLSEPENIAPGK